MQMTIPNPKKLEPDYIVAYNYADMFIEQIICMDFTIKALTRASEMGCSRRLYLQRIFTSYMSLTERKTLNIGCGDDPAALSQFNNVTHVDMDTYNHKNFIQVDAYNLHMFEDNSFDLAILGDILEHAHRPVDMIKEAGRVAKRVLLTIFEDWILPHDGLNIDFVVEKERKYLREHGFKNQYENMMSQPPIKDKIITVDEATWEDRLPSVWQFTEDMLLEIFEQTGMKVFIMLKFLEYEGKDHAFNNWLVLLVKE